MEVLPCLVHHSNLTVVVMNLKYGLDEYPPIAYHEKGTAFKRGVRSQRTNRQVIQQLARTMQAKRPSRKRGQRSRIIAVGTHRDCVQGDLAARLEALDRELRKILLPSCKDELILYCSSGKITFAVNLLEPDDDDDAMLDLIREKLSESGVGEIIEVPGSFLMFEQDLLMHAGQVGRDILSLEECQQVGERLRMTGEVVEAALIYVLPPPELLPLLPTRAAEARLCQATSSARFHQRCRLIQLQSHDRRVSGIPCHVHHIAERWHYHRGNAVPC